MNQANYLITLEAPAVLEDQVVDCLLILQAEQGFNSYTMNQHHHIHNEFSLREQMRGYQDKMRFQMQVSEEQLPQLRVLLSEQLAGSGINYWIIPVIESGVL